MTLSAYLLDQRDKQMAAYGQGSMAPNVNPQTPMGRTTYEARQTPGVMNGIDGSQFGAQHGMPMSPWASPGFFGTPGQARFTPWSEEKVAALQARLQRKLGPEFVTQRPGPGGGPKLNYIEGWKVINLANEVFGFNGWSSAIQRLHTDFLDEDNNGRCRAGVTAVIRITLADGCSHEDVGFGHCENVKGKGMALEKAQKEAVTDGIKRTLKHFGNVLGNCLYDKDYTKAVQRMHVPPAKWNPDELERRPEFTPKGATRPAPPAAAASAVPQHVSGQTKPPAPPQAQRPAAVDIPNHMRAGTPLRSIDEDEDMADPAAVGDDTEFAFMEEESFFDEFDQSVLGARAGDAPMLGEDRPAPRSEPEQAQNAGPSKPVYQHRHRPDMPPPHPPAHVRSSGESSKTASDSGAPEPMKRKVGGFAMPNGNANGGGAAGGGGVLSAPSRSNGGAPESAADAAARRRAAIQASFVPEPTRGPSHGQQPHIPSGGVNGVASRANANLREHGAQLEIPNGHTGAQGGGFTSARGVKREGGSQSPNKMERARSFGQRAALSEIPIDNAHGSKRSRVSF